MIFRDWRYCDISTVPLDLDKKYIYYLHARAWGLKGLVGATHSWFAVWSAKLDRWLVIENTDAETVGVQKAHVLHTETASWIEKGPFISDRDPRQKWFGGPPKIVGKISNPGLDVDQLIGFCKNYPIKEFDLLTKNCHTFSSYFILVAGLDLKRPFRSTGFRSPAWWKRKHGIKF